MNDLVVASRTGLEWSVGSLRLLRASGLALPTASRLLVDNMIE